VYKLTLGDDVQELRKSEIWIGWNGDIEEAQWNYLMDVLDQMIIQSTHYTTNSEKKDSCPDPAHVNFKGLNGSIPDRCRRGEQETVIALLSSEVFNVKMSESLSLKMRIQSTNR